MQSAQAMCQLGEAEIGGDVGPRCSTSFRGTRQLRLAVLPNNAAAGAGGSLLPWSVVLRLGLSHGAPPRLTRRVEAVEKVPGATEDNLNEI